MNCFPNNQEEKNLIEFIARYQYLNVNDAKYFFKSKSYYQKRISNLVAKGILRRTKLNLVLGKIGIEYAKMFNLKYSKMNRNVKYLPRLLYLSNFGAFFYNSNTIKFTPSFEIKNKQIFTTIARRFIGILDINGIEYLTYHISEENDNRYLANILYDVQKEKEYKNIIILIDNMKRVNINDFSFGMNHVLVLEDTQENREKLKYLHSIRWSKIINDLYKNKVYLSEYNFCDYTDSKSKYVATFYFIDTEKINRIKFFLRENKNRNIDIICCSTIAEEIKKQIPRANYIIVDFEKYIDKGRNIYD